MAQKYIIGDTGSMTAFDASLPEQDLENLAYTPELLMPIAGLQNGVTPGTIANLLASWNPISVLVGGDPIINFRAEALYALMVMWLKKNPLTLISVNDNENLFFSALKLPLWIGPTANTVKIKITRVAPPATIDTLTHQIIQRYAPARPSEVDAYLRILEQVYTPASTGAFLNAGRFENRGDIVGMLIFSTTIPIVTSLNTSARGIRLTSTEIDPLVLDWLASGADQDFKSLRASPGDITILDNYRFWDLSETPIPAGANPKIEFFSNDTNEVRFYFVEEVRI